MIIVLCPLKSNRVDRWCFTDEIVRELGYWKDDERLLDKLPDYRFMPNTKLENKLPVVACFEGHINIWKRIIDEDLKDVLVVEDDSDIDYDAFNKFLKDDKPDGLIYLGGVFNYPKVKQWDKERSIVNYMKGKSVNGFNKITDDFIVSGTFGYFIKDKEVAEELLKQSKGGSGKYKSTLIDLVISKTQINKNYYYPSIVNCIISESLIKNKIIHNTTWENYI
tara:strand:- start:2920 stop:3585 length:666 start_codon:yes stop_codon:yes gene_type:complete